MNKFCPKCENYCDTIDKTIDETFKIKGINISIPVLVSRCCICEETITSDEQDQTLIDIINKKYDEIKNDGEKNGKNRLEYNR